MGRLIDSRWRQSGPSSERMVMVGNIPIRYQVAGSGKPLVLVHGLSGSARWWFHNLGPLSNHFTVYAFSPVRFGLGYRRPRFVLEEASALLHGWMNRIGLERASFVGHSMGGFVVADLAAEHPQMVDRIVFVDAAALPFARGMPGAALGLVRGAFRLRPSFVPILLGDFLRTGPLTIWSQASQLLAADIHTKVERIKAPVLIIWGSRDTLVPVSVGKKLHAALPGSRLVLLRGAGHNPMWDRPEEFNRLVRDFVSSAQPFSPTSR